MKYKQLYENKKREIDDLEYEVRNLKATVERMKDELQAKQGYIQAIESRELSATREVDWLRDTLRLVIIDAGKMPELARLIDEERSNRRF